MVGSAYTKQDTTMLLKKGPSQKGMQSSNNHVPEANTQRAVSFRGCIGV